MTHAPDYAARQAMRAAYRAKRDLDIQASVKAGVPLIVLGMRYQITRERVRQIGKGKECNRPSMFIGVWI